ncbi:AraC family transcriptional regulator [Caballeronia udeis]|uniref:AraC family transcriptional regulator n=1 Tax=Caballeronia udeis TaxID=1232866 RepID=A0A158GE92_9BURK|nr:AraC family transcriptional regulator [Caballeronia udeis]SAL30448.1 AraC family transcriptional regulator [Caballeronia udeis]
MKTTPDHCCRVFGSPWADVYCTDIESARHYGKHWHATFGLGLLESGAQSSASGLGQVEAYAGNLITTNPGEVHDGRPLGGASRRWRMVYLEPRVIASMQGDPQSCAAPDVALTRPVIEDERLRAALQELFRRVECSSPGQQPTRTHILACEESLVQTCALLLNVHSTTPTAREIGGDIRRVRERLGDDLLDPPTLTELAVMSGLSKYQVLRRFEKTYGVPPHAWLLQQRAEHARGLIRKGLSLAQAAASCGFADQSHMTRLFIRYFGFTPGAWQKATARALQ